MRIGTKTIGVMDVVDYDISKQTYNGADKKVYKLDDIEYFILIKEEFLKLIGFNEVKKEKEVVKTIEVKDIKKDVLIKE